MTQPIPKPPDTPPAETIIKAEIPIVEKIIRDETWLEGERRGTPVTPDDPAVIKKVCSVIEQNAPKIVAEATQAARSGHTDPSPSPAGK